LKALAEKVQEIDKKRQSDKELIIGQIEKLGKIPGDSPKHSHATTPSVTPVTGGGEAATPSGPQKGYYYAVQQGDSLSAIAKAYRDKGVKVTTSQILAANPGLDANKLYTGKKIFIPDANAP
jgi:LysM repeat protein